MSWERVLANAIRTPEAEKITPEVHLFMGTVQQVTPLKILAAGGQLVIDDTNSDQTATFKNRTLSVNDRVAAIGNQRFLLIDKV